MGKMTKIQAKNTRFHQKFAKIVQMAQIAKMAYFLEKSRTYQIFGLFSLGISSKYHKRATQKAKE